MNLAMAYGLAPLWGAQTARDVLYVDDYNQQAVCITYQLALDEKKLLNPNLSKILKGALEKPLPEELIYKVVGTLNLHCKNSAVAATGAWMNTSLTFTGMRGGIYTDYAPSHRRDWRRCTIDHDQIDDFMHLYRGLSKGSIWKRMNVAIIRFSNSTSRVGDEEAVVDLAVAAEALFGSSYQGEATYKLSLNAAVFLASSEWSSSGIRAFFREVYGRRSAIVHGTDRSVASKTQTSYRNLRKRLESVMRTSLKQAVLELMQDSAALDWEKRLDFFLDHATKSLGEDREKAQS
jgi:hypothetical protein